MSKEVRKEVVNGLDLGTSNICIATIDELGKPVMIAPGDGSGKVPSEIYLSADGNTELYGEAARNMYAVEPKQVFSDYKRKLGSDEVLGVVGRRQILAEYLIRKQTEETIRRLREYLGDLEAVFRLVVTVPAQFDELQRQLTRAAYEDLGCEVLETVNEPTAAVLAFDLPQAKGDCVVVVNDFGGGTADVSVVAVEGGNVNVLATAGDNKLGGVDVDARIRDLIIDEFEREHGVKVTMDSHPGEFCEIFDRARQAKEHLSSRREASIRARVGEKSVSLKLTRDRLSELIGDLMDRLEALTSTAVKDAGLQLTDIDHVLLVGGSSRLHAVKDLVIKLFGKSKLFKSSVSPDFAVAQGAARLAARLVEERGEIVVDAERRRVKLPLMKHVDVNSYPLGMAVQESVDSDTKICSVLLPKNTPLPATVTEAFTSVTDDQRIFDIKILQGEEGQLMEECIVVGDRELEFEPRDRRTKSFEVTLIYDKSSQSKVLVKDLISGREEDITVNFVDGRGGR